MGSIGRRPVDRLRAGSASGLRCHACGWRLFAAGHIGRRPGCAAFCRRLALIELAFAYQFSYPDEADGITIPVTLSYGGQHLTNNAKVDPGAAVCFFKCEHAEELGLNVERGTFLSGAMPAMKPARLVEFMNQMAPNSVAVFASAHEIRRNQDSDFEFRQDTDFYYLTRLNEPDCVAVLAPHHPQHKYILFVRPRVKEEEIWTGLRAGVEGAIKTHGADAAYDIAQLPEILPQYLNGADTLYYRLGMQPAFDAKLIELIKRLRERVRYGEYGPTTIIDPVTLVHEMRLRKDAADIADLRRAAAISAAGHVAALKHCQPGMFEYELEALVEYVFRKSGAAGVGYPSIVGSGFNTTILHYNTNNEQIKDGDMVLIDAGAEYNLFTGDITRSFPANGKFSKAQRAIYEAVLAANKAVIALVKPGLRFTDPPRPSGRSATP